MAIFSRILFAVKDTDPRRPQTLAKAIALAKACDASLELFHAVSTLLYLPDAGTEASIAGLKRDTLDLHAARLEKMAARARRHGVPVTTTVCWDHPPHEAIVRRAHEMRADLIVADVHAGGGLPRMRFTDWELLRTSARPVLLLRDPRPYRHPAILAAVDPMHAHAKPAALDENILVAGRALSATLRGKLHLVHANHPPYLGIATESPFTVASLLEAGQMEFARFLAHADVPPRHGHLVDGDPVKVIPRVADEIPARIVVMGAVSRSGLGRVFIGNTAERVLDRLACDVLVVKPEDFSERVSAAHRDAVVLAPTPASARAG
jgi:universal stress protein E